MSEQDANNPWETGFQPPAREVQTIEALLQRINDEHLQTWNPRKTRDILTNDGSKEVVVGVDYEAAGGTELVVGGNFDQLSAIAAVFGEHPGNLLHAPEPRYITLEANGRTTTARLVVVPSKPQNINVLAMTGPVIDAIKPEGGEVIITEMFQRIQDLNLDNYL